MGGVHAAARLRLREGSVRAGRAKKIKPKTKTTRDRGKLSVALGMNVEDRKEGRTERRGGEGKRARMRDAASPCNGEDEDERKEFIAPGVWNKQRELYARLPDPAPLQAQRTRKKRPDIVRFVTATSTGTSSGARIWDGVGVWGISTHPPRDATGRRPAETETARAHGDAADRHMAQAEIWPRRGQIEERAIVPKGGSSRSSADPSKMSLWREQQAAGIQ
ncbi:hypothetical protein K438DRAFT_2086176 [Mycena galopus ATCC 62051]|nr:hypothetical protein K438DRAFT_2086176 [Mycena galopus ATCC 62051]